MTWYKEYQVDVPEGILNNVAVVRFQVSKTEADIGNIRAMLKGRGGKGVGTMEAKLQDLLGRMKYKRFWHRDNGRDVVCVNFHELFQGNDTDAGVAAESEALADLAGFLTSSGVEAYRHTGPTGGRFVAVPVTEKAKIEALL